MANTREIKLRIKGINETKKITKAMKLISASKLKKAKMMHEATMPYFKMVQETMNDILIHLPKLESVYFDKRENKKDRKVGYIVIASDKGLNGGYNHNIIKLAESVMDKEHAVVFPIGNVVVEHMERNQYNVVKDFGLTGEITDIEQAQNIADYMIKMFHEGRLDEVKIVFTEMLSAISLKPRVMTLLPLEKEDLIDENRESKRITLTLEPTPEAVLNTLARKYVKGILYSGFIEAYVSEHSARMNAMDNATNNAEEIVRKLTLTYNRARQTAITQEITEIISGASNV